MISGHLGTMLLAKTVIYGIGHNRSLLENTRLTDYILQFSHLGTNFGCLSKKVWLSSALSQQRFYKFPFPLYTQGVFQRYISLIFHTFLCWMVFVILKCQ